MTKPPISLDLIQIASPCEAPWEAMSGDERQRFCAHCKLHVYNLSEMTRSEAQQFLEQREGRTCVRLFRRGDGTVLTRDCPVGLKALRQRLVRGVAALAGMVVALLGGTLLGGAFNRLKPAGMQTPSAAFANWVDPQPEPIAIWGIAVMGDIDLSLPSGPYVLEPAESPLPEPTPEQLEAIAERLAH